MAGRPTKLNSERAQAIVERLRAGCTRKTAAECGGVPYRTFLNWFQRGERATAGEFRDFYQQVEHAEAEAEEAMTKVVREAAEGYDASELHTTVKTEIRTKKTRSPDGTVIEEPVPIEVRSTTKIVRTERDPKLAIEWLKRRRREEWGDSLLNQVTFLKKVGEELQEMSDAEIVAGLAGGGALPAASD